MNNSGRLFWELISLANASQMLGRSTEWMASNSATASFALLDCSGPIRCTAMPGQAETNSGHFALASCTRFSPNTRCPASIMGEMAVASNVFDTAISVTEARSRRASLHARCPAPPGQVRLVKAWLATSSFLSHHVVLNVVLNVVLGPEFLLHFL